MEDDPLEWIRTLPNDLWKRVTHLSVDVCCEAKLMDRRAIRLQELGQKTMHVDVKLGEDKKELLIWSSQPVDDVEVMKFRSFIHELKFDRVESKFGAADLFHLVHWLSNTYNHKKPLQLKRYWKEGHASSAIIGDVRSMFSRPRSL